MIRFWLLALRNLRRNVKRNIATGSAIAFGLAGILLLGGYTYRVTNFLRVYTVYVTHTGHVAIFKPEGLDKFSFQPERYSLDRSDLSYLDAFFASQDDVDFKERQIRGQGLIGNGCVSLPFAAQGFEAEVERMVQEHPERRLWMRGLEHLSAGRGLWNFEGSLNPVLLSRGLARALGKTSVRDDFPPGMIAPTDCSSPDIRQQYAKDANVQLLSTTWSGSLSAVDGEIVGNFSTGIQESENSALVANVDLLQRLFDTDHVTQYSVWLKDPKKIADLIPRWTRKFREDGKSFDVIRWDEERLSPYYTGTIQFLNTMVTAVSLILASIITLSVLNSTTMTILERSQEIGMYRAMGFRREHLRALYILETLWLSLGSLVAGAGFAVLAVKLINAAEVIYHPPGVAGGMILVLVLDWSESLKSSLLILGLALTATYFALSGRLKLKPADLLGGTYR